MKILSIFVDESGDFGEYNSKFAPQYILSMVKPRDLKKDFLNTRGFFEKPFFVVFL